MNSEKLQTEIKILSESNATANQFKLLLELAVRTIFHLEQKLEATEQLLDMYKKVAK